MTSEEYEQKLEALEREIAALRREAVEDGAERPKPPLQRWKPGPGNDYYFIGNAGDVYGDAISEFTGRGVDLAKSRAAIGNIFAKTDEEDAENCIKAVGKDRLIKYYFGVRDHEIPAETE